jgi:hypothetical protein
MNSLTKYSPEMAGSSLILKFYDKHYFSVPTGLVAPQYLMTENEEWKVSIVFSVGCNLPQNLISY